MSFELILSIVSLVVGLFSVAIGGFSVWLALYFKKEADRVNERTSALLVEVKTDAKVIATFTAGELKSWGDVGRRHILGNVITGDPAGKVNIGGPSEPANVPTSSDVAPPTGQQGGSDEVRP